MVTWLITGASRGFGLEIARQALERGDAVVATARDPRAIPDALPGFGDRLLATTLDVTDEAQARAAVAAAVDRFGSLEVLVNNAGRGLLGAVEEASDAAARAMYDINVFGLLAVCRAALPVLRAQRSGHVINIGSVGGIQASASWGVYCSTKFAVAGISEAMRTELAPLGVHVTVVEPGYFRTDFLDAISLEVAEDVIGDYAATSGAMRDAAPSINHAQPGDPVKGAAAIIAIAGIAEPPVHLPLGSDCVAVLDRKLESTRAELARWRELSVSTDHELSLDRP